MLLNFLLWNRSVACSWSWTTSRPLRCGSRMSHATSVLFLPRLHSSSLWILFLSNDHCCWIWKNPTAAIESSVFLLGLFQSVAILILILLEWPFTGYLKWDFSNVLAKFSSLVHRYIFRNSLRIGTYVENYFLTGVLIRVLTAYYGISADMDFGIDRKVQSV